MIPNIIDHLENINYSNFSAKISETLLVNKNIFFQIELIQLIEICHRWFKEYFVSRHYLLWHNVTISLCLFSWMVLFLKKISSN